VNFSSSAVGLALPSYAAYGASKSACDAITPVLARELSAGDITVNAIAPAPERPAPRRTSPTSSRSWSAKTAAGQRAGDPGERRHR
jgi:NAD(P)-dependent dehydrogenase (short-subunit alcohol dehydrogenase family)